jgi:Flp pilus assembly protein TadG
MQRSRICISGKQRSGLVRLIKEDQNGQALIETAISMGLLLSLFLGAAQFGTAVYQAIEVSDAARAGVNYGSQDQTDAADTTGISAMASADAPNLTGLVATSSVSCICSDGTASTCAAGDCSTSHIEHILTVNTHAPFTPMVQIPGMPLSFTMYGKAVQKVLQ